jgi:DNA invertase Pin-like site-specific DNA recombinase
MTPRKPRVAPPRATLIALAYTRVSTDEQASDGASLASQGAALATYADLRGWSVVPVSDPGVSGKNLDRPGMTYALSELAAGNADVLLATALDRMSRNVADVAHLMQASLDQGWALVSVRESIDTSTAMGRAFVQIAAVFAELERGLIAERVKAGMTQKRLDREHMGRRTRIAPWVLAKIHTHRDNGWSYAEIAQWLMVTGVPSPGRYALSPGSTWSVSSVQSALSVVPDPPAKGQRRV